MKYCVLPAQRRGHIDMGDVVAGGRIDPVQGFEKDPVAAKAFGNFRGIGVVCAGKAVAQRAAVVAGIGMIEAGLALQRRFAAWCAVLCQGYCEQGVPDRAAFAQ